MSGSKLPCISVIITAYNRKEFLLNAINSAVNQTLDKKYYEIIVVKNFTENTIDRFIDEHHIKNIQMDGAVGEFLYAGVSASSGEIISFLDDDDLFSNDKLEVVYNKFKANINLCYYHNSHISVNEKYQKLDSKLGKSITFNLSSISLRKSILKLNNLEKISSNTDHFMYLSALESGKNIISGKDNLTYYMFHNSVSHIDTIDINEFIQNRNPDLEEDVKPFIMFGEMFVSVKAKNYIKQKITNIEIDDYILGVNKKPRNAINILKKCDRAFSARLEIYFAYLLVRFHYNFRYIVIKKFMNNNKKS